MQKRERRPMQHCLVIEDSSVIRRAARAVFESLNFRVSDAETAEEALERVVADTPELVFIGWQLSGAPVHELMSKIRTMPLQKRPYILYVPTENDTSDIRLAFRAGADAYVLKPFNREIIEMKLHEIRVAA
jgi:two-component system, chemotaxis family, chemotaxis protein CheY